MIDTLEISLNRLALLPIEAKLEASRDILWLQLLLLTTVEDRLRLQSAISIWETESPDFDLAQVEAEREDFIRRWRDPMYAVREGAGAF